MRWKKPRGQPTWVDSDTTHPTKTAVCNPQSLVDHKKAPGSPPGAFLWGSVSQRHGGNYTPSSRSIAASTAMAIAPTLAKVTSLTRPLNRP